MKGRPSTFPCIIMGSNEHCSQMNGLSCEWWAALVLDSLSLNNICCSLLNRTKEILPQSHDKSSLLAYYDVGEKMYVF